MGWLELRKAGAGLVFAFVLLAYTVQTELAQHVTQSYAKPYFLLYLTHSSYMLVAPVHLFGLWAAGLPVRAVIRQVKTALHRQFGAGQDAESPASNGIARPSWLASAKKLIDPTITAEAGHTARLSSAAWTAADGFPLGSMCKTIVYLTFLIALPAASWYGAVPLTSMTDITAIYNSNAFWAYVFSIYFLGTERWEVRKVLSVSLACIGVFIIAYGDSDELDHVTPPEGGMDGETKLARRLAPSIDIGSRLLGNLLALIGSLSFGLYEVWYKRYAALPDEMGAQVTVRRVGMTRSTSNATLLTPGRDRAARFYDRSVLGPDSAPEDDEQAATPATHEMPIGLGTPPPSRRPLTRTVSAASLGIAAADAYQTPPVVFLTHANFITSMIGVFTLLLLWVPIPILHFTGIEPFELPPNLGIVGSIIAMVICGVIFNCGFMLLLGLWGPVVASVGNLCTLVLVAIADTFVMSSALSMSALIGCGLIVGAFSVLLVDMLTSDPESKPAADVNEEVYALGDDDEDDDESVPADTTRP